MLVIILDQMYFFILFLMYLIEECCYISVKSNSGLMNPDEIFGNGFKTGEGESIINVYVQIVHL